MNHDKSMVPPCPRWLRAAGEPCGAILSPLCPTPECATPLSQPGLVARGQSSAWSSSHLEAVTAQLVPGKTHTLVVLIKQRLSLVEADRSASLAINGIEFSSTVLGEQGRVS